MRSIPPLSAVRVFEAAARLLNYTRAGEELGMTQAAVSYQIKLLEERLGLKLFRREGRAVVLTDAGRKAAPLVSSGFDTIEDAFRQLRADDEGVLTISAFNTFATQWLAPRIGAFQLANPDLAIRLTASDPLIDLVREGIDVALRGGRGDWPGLAADFLLKVHFTPLASPDFVARHRLVEPRDLLRVPLLTPQDYWWRDWFALAGIDGAERSGIKGVRLDGQVFDGVAAMAGQGVAILSPAMWRRGLDAGRLVLPFPEIAIEEGNCYWLVRPEGRPSRKVRRFREWLLAEIAAAATADPNGVFHHHAERRASDRDPPSSG